MRHAVVVSSGAYAELLAPWLEAFGAARVMVVQSEELYGVGALALMHRVAAFLGARPFAPHEAATFGYQRGTFGGGANSPGSPTSAYDLGAARAPDVFNCDDRSSMARYYRAQGGALRSLLTTPPGPSSSSVFPSSSGSDNHVDRRDGGDAAANDGAGGGAVASAVTTYPLRWGARSVGWGGAKESGGGASSSTAAAASPMRPAAEREAAVRD